MLEQRGAVVPRHVLRGIDDVVPRERRDGDHVQVGEAERFEVAHELVVALLRPVDEIHLVDRDGDVRDAQERRDVRMAARLLDDAVARIDEDDGDVRGRGARDHVARVLHVARRICQLEAAARRDEPAVRDIDRDPLLALGAQAVGQLRKVDVVVAAPARRLLDVLHLVDEDLLRVVEEAADQRRLAVVDGAAGDEPQKIWLLRKSLARSVLMVSQQKYPTRLRSSIAASLTRSSARVSPRSVTRVAAISPTTSGIVAASLTTPPVHVMSPTVRKRTVALNGSSPSIRSTCSDTA